MCDYGATDDCDACLRLEEKAGNHTPECRARFRRMLERDGKIKPVPMVGEIPLTPADPLRGTEFSTDDLMKLFDAASADAAASESDTQTGPYPVRRKCQHRHSFDLRYC